MIESAKEFNEKYKDYLVEGFYGLQIDNPELVIELDQIFEGLIKIPGFKYFQIKSKFSVYRVYTNLGEILNIPVAMLINHGIERMMEEILNEK